MVDSIARLQEAPGEPSTFRIHDAAACPGDLLAVATTGAYCYSLASNYNQTGRPSLVAVREGSATPWLRRETFDDLRALEVDEAAATRSPASSSPADGRQA